MAKSVKPILPELLHDLAHEDYQVRAAAVKELGKTKNPGAIPHLVQMADDRTVTVRAKVAQAVKAFVKEPDALRLMIRLAADEHGVHKWVVPKILEMKEGVLPYLFENMAHQNDALRQTSIHLISQIQPEALDAHLERMIEDSQINIRVVAVERLQKHLQSAPLSPEMLDKLAAAKQRASSIGEREMIQQLIGHSASSISSATVSNKQVELVREKIAQVRKKKGKVLDLSVMELSSLPPEIIKADRIVELYLFDNQFTTLPPEIGQLSHLRRLLIYNNRLRSLPDEIGQLAALEELYLSDNQLTALPESIGNLKNLRVLNVMLNQIEVLPVSMANLVQLESLNVSFNRLAERPTFLANLPKLTHIDLSNNPQTETS